MQATFNFDEFAHELVQPVFTKVAAPTIYRSDRAGDRYYYLRPDEFSDVRTWLMSVTTAIAKHVPAPFLATWRGDLGNELADHQSAFRATYGTLYHTCATEFLRTGKWDFGTVVLEESPAYYLSRAELVKDGFPTLHATNWAYELNRDMAAFIAFIEERAVEPIAIEIPVLSTQWGLAGCVDLVCYMKPTPKASEKVVALVDLKSGRKGFHESHQWQLAIYQRFWNETYPQLAASDVFNLAPTAWKSAPNFTLANQTDKISEAQVDAFLTLHRATYPTHEPPQAIGLVGKYEGNISQNVKKLV